MSPPGGLIDDRTDAIAADSGGSEIVLSDMRPLLVDDLAELADAFTQVLRRWPQARDLAIAG
jgi:hypothetical protein